MKKFLYIVFLVFILLQQQSYCVEEIELEKEPLSLNYLSDVYYGKVENKNEVSPILRLFSQKGLEFENSPIDAIKLTFLFDGQFQYNNTFHTSPYFKHDFVTAEPMITMYLNDRKTEIMFDYNILRDIEPYKKSFAEKITRAYVAQHITKNQTIILGQGARIPTTFEGSRGTMAQDFIIKAQLGRTFGDIVSTGIRNEGKYKYLDYDIGLYDSTRFMQEFGHGLEFTGYLMLKPFANREDEFKNFKLGSGYNLGSYKTSYHMYSVFAGYDHKKVHAKIEYANADGYNGIFNSKNNADGFYTTLIYDITPKLSILARYDYFTADRRHTNSYCQEYAAGITYRLFKNMKLMFNFINKNYSNKSDSNMILFATRFII